MKNINDKESKGLVIRRHCSHDIYVDIFLLTHIWSMIAVTNRFLSFVFLLTDSFFIPFVKWYDSETIHSRLVCMHSKRQKKKMWLLDIRRVMYMRVAQKTRWLIYVNGSFITRVDNFLFIFQRAFSSQLRWRYTNIRTLWQKERRRKVKRNRRLIPFFASYLNLHSFFLYP